MAAPQASSAAPDAERPLIRSRAELERRQFELLQRSAELRGALTADLRQLDRPLRRLRRGQRLATWLWAQRRALGLGLVAGVAVLALRRPRAVLQAGWRWGRRGWKLWRSWQRWQPWLAPLLARWRR
ncbi:MAG: YqjK-like protein [Pseudomonadota bacterium]